MARTDAEHFARQLSGLGYPGFAHLRPCKASPAAVVLGALLQNDLDTRVAEALPWVLLTYPDLDWGWLVRQGKRHDVQNRLGFLVAIAKEFAAGRPNFEFSFTQLSAAEKQLEHARLAREDTLCRESMPAAEHTWLKTHRSAHATHWNLLTGLTADQYLMPTEPVPIEAIDGGEATLSELRQADTNALGFDPGRGDYTAERDGDLGNTTVDELVDEIEQRRQNASTK